MDAGALCSEVAIAAKGFSISTSAIRYSDRSWPNIDERLESLFPPSAPAGSHHGVCERQPDGPLHIGHGRGAAVGDVLAAILRGTGHEVVREYYCERAGRQIRDPRGSPSYLRWKELRGGKIEYPSISTRGPTYGT